MTLTAFLMAFIDPSINAALKKRPKMGRFFRAGDSVGGSKIEPI
jgi:hypothetical protein